MEYTPDSEKIKNYVSEKVKYNREVTKEIQDFIDKGLPPPFSEDTASKISDFISGWSHSNFNIENIKECQLFTLDHPIRLYRGLHFSLKDVDKAKNFMSKTQGENIILSNEGFTSWTWNLKIAEGYGKLGCFNYIITKVFHPSEILIDLRLVPHFSRFITFDMVGDDVKKENSIVQDEVIVMPSENLSVEIYSPNTEFNKNSLLLPSTLEGLKQLYSFYEFYISGGGSNYLLEPPITKKSELGLERGGLVGVLWTPMYSLCFNFVKTDSDFGLLYGYIEKLSLQSLNSGLEIESDNTESFIEALNTKVKYLKSSDGKTSVRKIHDCIGCDPIFVPYIYKFSFSNEIRTNNFEKLCLMFIEDLFAITNNIMFPFGPQFNFIS